MLNLFSFVISPFIYSIRLSWERERGSKRKVLFVAGLVKMLIIAMYGNDNTVWCFEKILYHEHFNL